MKKTTANLIVAIVACLAMSLTFALPAYASGGNGDGSGDGSGGGGSLTLTGSSIQNGQIDPGDTITLTFSNNVINESVRENNKNAITLYDSNNNPVAIEIIMADEQINPDAKRIISVEPLDDLTPGAEYTLVINSGIQAKNGSNASGDYRLAFTVTGAAPSATPALDERPTPDVPPAANTTPEAYPPDATPPAPTPTGAAPNDPLPTPTNTLPADPPPPATIEYATTEPHVTPAAPETDPPPAPSVTPTANPSPGNIPQPVAENISSVTNPAPANQPSQPNPMAITMFICAGAALCALAVVLIIKSRAKTDTHQN